MYVLWRIIVKEFLQLRQDKRMIPVIFVAPAVQLILFGFAVNLDVADVPLLLVDQDHTAASRDLTHRFLASDSFRLAGVESSANHIDGWLLSGRAQAVLVIGQGYGKELASGRTPSIQLIADGADASATMVALGYASAIVAEENAELIAVNLRGGVLRGRGGGPPGLIEAVPRVWYNPDLKSRWYFVPAVLAMILMVMTMMLAAMGVVREKEIGTMEQIIVTPIRPWQLLVGKLFPFALIGLMQVFIVTALAVWGFGVPLRGSFLLLLALTQLFVLNTLGLGLLVSTMVRTQQQAMILSVFGLMVPMIYLSGLIFPIENMPPFVQGITYAVPLRYYAVVIRGIFLRGSGLEILWPQAAVLAGTGVLIMAVAAFRFRKRLD